MGPMNIEYEYDSSMDEAAIYLLMGPAVTYRYPRRLVDDDGGNGTDDRYSTHNHDDNDHDDLDNQRHCGPVACMGPRS